MGNAPLNKVDPTDNDAIVVLQKNGDVDVTLPFTSISGDAANPKNVSQFMKAVTFSQTVNGRTITVTGVNGPSPLDPSVQNSLTLTSGPTSGGGEGGTGHSYVRNGTDMHITEMDVNGTPIRDPGGRSGTVTEKPGIGTERHEAGHAAGLDQSSVKDNLMGPGRGEALTPQQIDSIATRRGDSGSVVNTIVNCSDEPAHAGCH